MPQSEHFDVVILGSGQGGKLLAWNLGRSGKKVAVVERRWVGGSCPAVACMPSKNELWSARVAHIVRNAAEFGTLIGEVRTDMRKVRSRKQDMVEREIAIHLKAYKESGAELIMGSGRFVGPKTIEVALNDGGARTLSGAEVVLNLGSHAAIPDIPGLAAARPLTHIEALELDYLPSHLIVLGGGYVGIETAQTFRRLGSRVTIIEPGRQPMGREDRDVAEEIQAILTGEGVEVVLNADPGRVRGLSGDAVAVTVRAAEGERTIEGSDLIVAVGRVPNTADIGLDKTGVELDARSFIRVNERLQTTAPGDLGDWRVRGQPPVHPYIGRRLQDRRRQHGWRRSQDRRSAGSLCHVHRSAVGARRSLRGRSAASRRPGAGRAAANAPGPAHRGDRREDRLHEGGGQRERRSHSGLHHDRLGGRRSLGDRSDRDDGEASVHSLRDAVFSHLTMAEGLGFLFATVPERSA